MGIEMYSAYVLFLLHNLIITQINKFKKTTTHIKCLFYQESIKCQTLNQTSLEVFNQ